MEKIPIILERDHNHVVGFITLEDSFENTLRKGFCNHINFSLGGAVDLDKQKIVYLSISPDFGSKKE